MTTANRKDAREALAALIQASLVGTGKPLQVVYDHGRDDPQGQAPGVMITGLGTMRTQHGMKGDKWRTTFRLGLVIWVAGAEGSRDQDDVEDQLDDIEEAIAEIVAANRSSEGDWEYLSYEERFSEVQYITGQEGKTYLMEVVPIMARMRD